MIPRPHPVKNSRQRGRAFAIPLCAFAALWTFFAPAGEAVPTLTPRDVIGWMAPLRIDEGKLGVDWGSIGIIGAKHAGITTAGGRASSTIDTDVKFLITAGVPGAGKAPEFELVLNAKGGSSALQAGGDARALPISVGLKQKGAEGLRGELTVRGRLSQNGESYDASDITLNLDSSTCLALYTMNRKTRDFRLKFKEEKILKADLSITQNNDLLIVRVENTDVGTGFDLTQKSNGEAELSFSEGEAKRFVRGASFRELLQKHTMEMQLNFIRPLGELGVQIALNPDLPVTMAAATTGFSEPRPDVSTKADEMINGLADAPSPEERAKRVTELARFFPQAIFHIREAAENSRDPNLKAALQRAIEAHPGIARALPYVKAQKLHEDREYLFDIFENVPLFKDAARARLTVLLGKDYGDDIEAWKKQK